MTASLPPLAGRLLALALLVAVAALAWVGVGQPVIAKRQETRAQLEQTQELLQRYRAINAERDRLAAELAYVQEEVLPQSGLLPGDNPAIAAAELQSRVSGIVKASGGDLLSIQILPGGGGGGGDDDAAPGLRTVAVRVQFTADTEALTGVLHELESARPYLFLDNLQIRQGRTAARAVARRLRSRALSAQQPVEALFVTSDVSGYMRGAPS